MYLDDGEDDEEEDDDEEDQEDPRDYLPRMQHVWSVRYHLTYTHNIHNNIVNLLSFFHYQPTIPYTVYATNYSLTVIMYHLWCLLY